MPTVSLIMPCLNEELTIGYCIDEASNWALVSGVELEIIIADNGSTDDSVRIAQTRDTPSNTRVVVVNVQSKGYGNAIKGGVSAATSQYCLMGDADGSYDFADSSQIFAELQSGADLVVGNRFAGGIQKGAMPLLNRWVGNPFLSFVGRQLFGLRIRDFHCGLRGFSKQAFLEIEATSPGMEFASELIAKSSLLDHDIREVAVKLRKDGRDRKPHLRPLRDGFRHLALLMLLASPRKFQSLILAVVAVPLVLLSYLLLIPTPATMVFFGWEISLGLAAISITMCLVVTCCFLLVGYRIIRSKVVVPGTGLVGGDPWEQKSLVRPLVVVSLLFLAASAIVLVVETLQWLQAGRDLPTSYGSLKLVLIGSVGILSSGLGLLMSALALSLEVFKRSD